MLDTHSLSLLAAANNRQGQVILPGLGPLPVSKEGSRAQEPEEGPGDPLATL